MAEPASLPEVAPSCVGREVELNRLRALHEQALRESRGHIALVCAPAGLGKSALLAELRRRLRQAGVPVLEGRCRVGGAPYEAVREIVDAAIASLADAEADAATLTGAAEVSAALRGHARQDTAAPDRSGRLAFFERVAELLRGAAARTHGVVLLHDLHLADEATRALVDYLMRTLAPPPDLGVPGGYQGLVVVSTRDQASPPADLAATHLVLNGLDREGVRAFLSSAHNVERLLAASGGLPHTLEALLERPALDAHALIADRLNALSPGAAHLAGTLAVLGRPAGARLLARLGVSREHLLEVGQSPLCERSTVAGELQLAITHAEALRAQLPEAERRDRHRELGEALRALALAGHDGIDPAEVAHHLLTGGAGEPAVEAAIAAGDRLERAFAFERASELYAEALAVTRRPDLAERLAERLATLRELCGDYDRALEAAQAALALRPHEPACLARVGHLQLLRGDLPAALSMLTRAQHAAAERGDRACLARALADGAEAHFLAGAHDRALADGRAALDIAEGSTELLAPRIGARNSIGKVHLGQGEHDLAARCFAANLADARRAGGAHETARALVNLGIVAIRRGDFGEAESSYRAGLAAAEECGDVRHRAFCLQNLGVLAQWRRDYEQALGHYQAAIQAFMRLGHRPNLAWVALDLGDLYLGLGALEHAASMAEWAARIGGDSLSPTATAILAHLRGRLASERGDLAAARAELDRSLADARRAQSPDEETLALLSLARLELAEGEPLAARERLASLPRPVGARNAAAAALLAGEALLALARFAEARTELLRADAGFAALGDDEGRLRAALLTARAADRQGDARAGRRAREAARLLDGRLRARVPEAFAASYGREPLRLELLSGAPAGAPAPVGPRLPAPSGPLVAAGSPALRHGIVGNHPRLLHVLDLVERVATRDSLVLIRGESGTGKELVAEAIHRRSPRASRPFVKVNCAALVDTLLLSELFGHERGAFTGALARKKGRFELADGGTLFLDEIGDVSAQTQVALLRVLQTHEFERVGGTLPIRVDVRIVCATNRDLEVMVQRGQFREDLYYRLQGLELTMPPLRERQTDIPALARFFLERAASEQSAPARRLTPAAESRLCVYPWPGNIRELENVMRSVSLFCDAEVIDAPDLADYVPLSGLAELAARSGVANTPGVPGAPDRGHGGGTTAAAMAPATAGREAAPFEDIYARAQASGLSLRDLKREIERLCIVRALADAGGNITRAAEILRMKRPRLSQLLKEHGIPTRSSSTEVD